MSGRAPFHTDIAEGPDRVEAHWIAAEDGVRIRAAAWPEGERGTVFIFPGRCEYAEKYGRTARHLQKAGLASVAVDWRGQGLADRLLRNPDVGHVGRFRDYQHDARAVLDLGRRLGLPEPWYLLAHSMGGAIGLRSLIVGLPFRAAGFSAPMWGILVAPRLRHIARTVPVMARALGFGGRQAPTTNPADFFLISPFEGNFLTTDRDAWDYMKRQAGAEKRFRLGGPSLTWLAEALAETRALQREPKPPVPAHMTIGTEEKIVERAAVVSLAATWPTCSTTVVEGAEHEILMERAEVRLPFLDRVIATFDSA